MKRTILFFSLCFLSVNIFAQVNKTWIGAGGSNWNNATNWSPTGVPGATDTVILSTNNYCVVDINPTIAAIRALGVGNGNGLTNSSGVLKTITISSNPVSSPVVYVEAGSSFILGTFGSTSGVSITTYGAAGTTNTATIDGTIYLAYTSIWNVANGTAVTNVSVTSGGSVTIPGPHTAATIFLNSTTSNLRFFNGSNLGWGQNGGTIPAADYQNGSIINIGNISTTMPSFSNAANYSGLLTWNCTGQTISGASAVLLPSASYSMDSIRVISTGTGSLRLTTEPLGYTIGHLEVQGGTVEMSAPLTANRSASITTDLKISGGTVIGNATTAGESAGAYAMTLSVHGQLIMTGGTLNLTNRPTGLPTGGACQVNVAGDISQTAGTITTTTAFGSQNQIVLNGTAAQNLTMTTFSGTMSLVMSNTSTAGVALLSNLTIPSTGTLVLLTGVVTPSGTNMVTMNAGAAVFGASDASFINGKVKKIGITAFVFPVGSFSGSFKGYVPIEISATTGSITDEFTALYKRTTAEVYPITNAGIEHVSRADYWTLDRGGTIAQVNVTLHWTATSSTNGSPNYINNLGELIMAYCNGASWVNFSGLGQTTGNTTAGTIMWTSLTNTFGPFSLASTTINNPLPVNLNYLNGVKQNNANYIDWKVTCTNNPTATMVLERSADGSNFATITTVTADAVRCQQPFNYTDNYPLAGINYYRLKMIDANGKATYSTKIAVLNKQSGLEIVGLLPNLVNKNAVLNVTTAQKTKMDIVITDINGRLVQKINYELIAGSNQFTLNLSGLSAGAYQITGYTADGVSRTIRFVKQ